MKFSKALFISLVPLLVIGVAAVAAEKQEPVHGPSILVPPAAEGSLAVGDDCTAPIVIPGLPYTATAQTNCGRGNTYATTCLGSYDGGEDVMYQLTVAATTLVKITMDPLGTTWTGVLVDDTCPPGNTGECIAIATGSSGTVPKVIFTELAAGTYYIMVDTYPAPTCIPSFNLTVEEVEPYPNPTCATAIDLQEQSLASFEVNTCGSGSDYSPGTGGCTGYAANGEDAVYKIYLTNGETFTAFLTGESYDASLYLVTDCADVPGTCVAGGDDPEDISYTATADGWYFLIVDGYATGGCGTSTITIEAPVATEDSSWGTIKSMFR